MSDRVRFIEYKERQILLFDFSGITDEATALEAIERGMAFVAGLQADGSLLTLTDVTDSTSTSAIAKALYRLAKNNKPYVKAGAVVGVAGLEKSVFRLVTNLARRSFKVFDDRDAAQEWLVG